MKKLRCYYCRRSDRDMRPYGPGGSALCFACMTDPQHPEREEAAKRAFFVQIEASEVVGGGVSVLGENGPRPATEDEREIVRRAGTKEGGE